MGAIVDMGFLYLFLFITLLTGSGPVSSSPVEGCCSSKTVGPHSYTLVENETAPSQFGCSSSCVYKREGEENEKFCFKPGQLPVECTGEILIEISISFNVTGQVSGTIFAAPIKNFEYVVMELGERKTFYVEAGSIEKITASWNPWAITGPINCVSLTDIPRDEVSFSIQPFDNLSNCSVSVGP